MNERIKVKKSQVKPILAATFPEYKGRTINVEFASTVTFYDTNWGGGSRNSYVAVSSDGRTAQLNVPAPWLNVVEGQSIEMPEYAMIVEHSIFCGKDCGITIYAHPALLPKWLPAGS